MIAIFDENENFEVQKPETHLTSSVTMLERK